MATPAQAPKQRFRQRIPKPLTCDCTKRCGCLNPVPQPCGCVNHSGGEITYCRVHAIAPELVRLLRTICDDVAPDRFGDGRPVWYDNARALLARIMEGKG